MIILNIIRNTKEWKCLVLVRLNLLRVKHYKGGCCITVPFVLLVLVGTVFMTGPAGLLARLTPETLATNFWLVVVLIYYFLATVLFSMVLWLQKESLPLFLLTLLDYHI